MTEALQFHIKTYFLQLGEGDRGAFRALFDHYKETFYSAAYKMTRSGDTAEDIVQEVFILLWTKRTQVAAADHPEKYLFRILYNAIYTHFSKIASEKQLKQTFIREATDWMEPAFDLQLYARERREMLDRLIGQLPPQQQLVFKLSKQQGMSRNQIADRLAISPNSVKNHLHDAVKSLRLFLKDKKRASVLLLLVIRALS